MKQPHDLTLLTEARSQMAAGQMGYLLSVGVAHDDGEAVVIGGGVAKQVDDRAHPLDAVEGRDRGTHHLSAWRSKVKGGQRTQRPFIL